MATVEFNRAKRPRRKIVGQFCDCEYSADAADYFAAKPTTPFLCEHELPCKLVEQVFVCGTDDNGREYYGIAWSVIAEDATVNDL